MRKFTCAIAGLALCWSSAYADNAVPRNANHGVAVHPAVVAGSYTVDYVTGVTIPGQLHSRQTPVYDNTASASGTMGGGAAADVGELGDDIVMIQGGVLQEIDASLGNDPASGGNVESADIVFNFYDPNLVNIGTFTTHLDLTASPLPPGFVVTYTVTGLGGNNITLPGRLFVTQTVTNVVGGASLFDQAVYHPGALGDSADGFYLNGTTNFWFTNNPVANFYYGIRVDPVAEPHILWTTGEFRGVNFDSTGGQNYAVTLLGYSSGNIASAGRPQRWAAIPFRIDTSTTIGQIDVPWFDSGAGTQPANVSYIIWNRTGLAAPTTQFSSGVLGPFVSGSGNGSGSNNHSYHTNIAIPAGNYYLTVYGSGGTDPDNYINWFTGGEMQDPNLEQAFMWRAASFPSPGFANYAPINVAPGPGDTDLNCQWNPSFVLWSSAAPPICRGDANCDGQVNFGDINPFVLALSNFAGWQAAFPNCPTGNVDVNGDGSVNFNDINPFVTLLSGGGGPCH